MQKNPQKGPGCLIFRLPCFPAGFGVADKPAALSLVCGLLQKNCVLIPVDYPEGSVKMTVETEQIQELFGAVQQLSVDVGIPTKLEKLKEEDLPFLCESAAADACAPGNPREATLKDLEAMFRKLM